MRVAANCGEPRTVVYGLAMVSRKVSPAAMMQTPSRKAQNAAISVAGMNQSPPTATINRPAMMPPRYPSLVASQPAGSAMRK